MFTGIVTDIGTLKNVTRHTETPSILNGQNQERWGDTRMVVNTTYDIESLDIGASISHAGACMTIVDKGRDADGNWYAFDVSDESLDKTTLGSWRPGHKINLERALTGEDELGGHLVTGHVDCRGRLSKRDEIAGSLRLEFDVPEEIAFGIAPKGSITIDGVSLTVNEVDQARFSVNIIPHTASVTTLGNLTIGDEVNLEIDLIARYVARYLNHMQKGMA